ncbi:MAG: putative surface protease of transglutaminase family [Candidatus Methanohalarchaeum thermophilum]|uniref:Surface protease of transglutaminase family n=1 Tax=Methanohalarchaeum thermophilum TaxID=1903181 RepID=A0A1Q6DTW2_METT1|nr:MAG: putative surface protease of transglutaminase family [Candidatus Methanohalarchaeum thermophilum]
MNVPPKHITIITDLVNSFQEYAQKNSYNKIETTEMIIDFVHSLKYTEDKVTTQYDEYLRYSIETLVDQGGDYEDTAILMTTLLNEMDYKAGLAVLTNENHIISIVKEDPSIEGTYYKYNGNKILLPRNNRRKLGYRRKTP